MEYRTISGVPDVGYHLYAAADREIKGLTVAIPGKASLAFEQPGIGRKFLHAIKARDIVNLVEDRQRQTFPMPGSDRSR
jgi:hypothetical protein